MTLEVSAPAGGVIDIDTLHLPISVTFGVSGFPQSEKARTVTIGKKNRKLPEKYVTSWPHHVLINKHTQ